MICDLAIPGLPVARKRSQVKSVSQDAALVGRSIEGDEAAFQSLVEKYRPVAIHTAYGFLRDRDLARDISQEAFVRVFRRLRTFDVSRSFPTWLRRITVNLVIDELRRRRRRTEVQLDDGLPSGAALDPSTQAESAEDREAVWEVLAELPIKYRTVMTLREIEGLPTEQVARIVKRPEVTVRWRLHRARKLFRERWLARFGEAEI